MNRKISQMEPKDVVDFIMPGIRKYSVEKRKIFARCIFQALDDLGVKKELDE